jgi:hypothetical protein
MPVKTSNIDPEDMPYVVVTPIPGAAAEQAETSFFTGARAVGEHSCRTGDRGGCRVTIHGFTDSHTAILFRFAIADIPVAAARPYHSGASL